MRRAESLHLRRRHQAGVVVLVAGEGQAAALDGVGDEAGGPVVRAAASKASSERRQVVAAEIGHQPASSASRAPLDQARDRALVAEVVEQALAPGRAALEGQCGVELVRAVVDPVAQPFAAGLGEGRLAAARRI